MSKDIQSRQDYIRAMRSLARSSRFRRINSLDLIPEDPNQENLEENEHQNLQSDSMEESQMQSHALQQENRNRSLANGMSKLLLFWPNLLLHLVMNCMRYLLFIPFSIAAPSFWLSALLWIFWKLLRVPVSCIKWIIAGDTPSSEVSARTNKRTVLLSSGSTIQTLHLARNFYSSGARVVVFEFEGLFGLARFSAAVDKFYVVPRPSPNNIDSYISALCHIVRKEKPTVYVPVCSTSPAYYDSLAKPHLELLGCASFIPKFQETSILDDVSQFYQKCAAHNILLPPHTVLSSSSDLWHLYDGAADGSGSFISTFRNIIMAIGNVGLLERYKYILPNSRRDFKFNHDISEQQKWIVVRDPPGDHFVTCTTVKDSKVVANVTCRIDNESKNLIPVVDSAGCDDDSQIQLWLKVFFAKVRFQRSINGHISFRLVKCQSTGNFLPLGVRVGVSLPYICYNRSHAQVLCRTLKCVHMRQFNRSFLPTDELATSWRWSSIEKSSATAALDKREALFAYWDPLPYCAYYHFQLPLKSVKMFLQKRHRSSKNLSPRIMAVH